MIGAVIGDIVGSRFEWHNHKSKDFKFFANDCFFTDDTVCTCGVAVACLIKDDEGVKNVPFNILAREAIRRLCEMYPGRGYGGMFNVWLHMSSPAPYGSFGNGSAMRVSPVAYMGNTIKEVEKLAKQVSECTHNHPEGIKGAQAVAVAIYLARKGKSKDYIKWYIQKKYEYNLEFTLDEIRPTYKFYETCQDSVPQAIVCFLEGKDYEDTIRNAISIGGDSDTIACIAGSIAEAYYGVPEDIKKQALKFIPSTIKRIIDDFEMKYEQKVDKKTED